jgi:3-phenylpropionate/cinnamic acid dioxygenase small subunit
MAPSEVRDLLDRQQLTELVSRLGLFLDEQRWDDAPALFTADATATTPGGTAVGREALVAQAARNHTERTQHVITNCVVDLDGDRAAIGANLLVTFAPDEGVGEPRFQLGERYGFAAQRTGDGWRLSRVQTRPLWRVGEPPAR